MLQIQSISKSYADGTQALQQVSLQAGHGILGLLGPNGAGKSTLLRTIATLQTPDSGQLWFDDIDVLQQPQQLRAQLGYLPQQFGVYPHFSCRALLEHLAILKGLTEPQQRRRQLDEVLALTNLAAVADKTVAHFSGGMLQRFGIAQALLGSPRLLILDEPTAGLDPQERERFHQLLVEVSQQRLVLLSSHIVEDIERLCPQVVILLQGQVCAAAPTASLTARLQGQIWLNHAEPGFDEQRPWAGDAQLLSQTYLRGISQQRIFSSSQPTANCVAVPPTLQDCYVLALQQHKALQDAA